MKKLFIASLLFLVCFSVNAQKKKNEKACDSLVVDLDKGTLTFPGGMMTVKFTADTVKNYFGCSLKDDHEIHTGECGGGLRMEKQGVVFNSEKGFIELDSNTTAKLSKDFFQMDEDDLNGIDGLIQVSDLSTPDQNEPSESVYLFPKPFGCLAVWMNIPSKKVHKVQMHNKTYLQAFLCAE